MNEGKDEQEEKAEGASNEYTPTLWSCVLALRSFFVVLGCVVSFHSSLSFSFFLLHDSL